MAKQRAVVCGGGGFIGGHLVAALRRRGDCDVHAVDIKPFQDWYQRFSDVESRVLDLREKRGLPAGAQGCRCGLQPRRRHGRHGLHRKQQGPVHAQRADQHAPADGRPGDAASSGSSTPPPPACTPPTSRLTPNVTAAEGRGRLPGDARGRLRLGEAVQRADVPPLPRGLRHRPRAWRGSTTSTARTAPTTAGARKPRPPSAARSSRPSSSGNHEIEIWGDGQQTRSFMYIDDCLDGI